MTRKIFDLIFVALIIIGATSSFATNGRFYSVVANRFAPAFSPQNDGNAPSVKVYDDRRDALINADDAAPAPELATNGEWINSDPVTLESLRGRVVLLDFWSYRCPYCRAALPVLNRWNARFRKRGLIVLGVHSPMMESDKVPANVRSQVSALGVRYPVVTDNEHLAWDAFEMEAWPTVVILDKHGRIRFTHSGEGMYKETEHVIRKLLAE